MIKILHSTDGPNKRVYKPSFNLKEKDKVNRNHIIIRINNER